MNCYDQTDGAWYRLRYNPETFSLSMDVHADDVPQLKEEVMAMGERWSNNKAFKLGNFTSPESRTWGFGGNALRWDKLENGIQRISSVLPQATEASWVSNKAFNLSMTWSFVFTSLLHVDNSRPDPAPRLLRITSWGVGRGEQNTAYWAALVCDPVAEWLEKQSWPRNDFQPASMRMHTAFCRLTQSDYEYDDFWTSCRTMDDKWLYLKVPGDCACFGRDGMEINRYPKGYPLYAHNVDFPAQQLAQLVGLITVSEHAAFDLGVM